MSNVMAVHEMNPDPGISTCRVYTGNQERGIVFLTIEPLEGVYTFVGETAMLEAMGMLYELTPNDVLRALGEGTQAQEKKLAKEKTRADKWEKAYHDLMDLVERVTQSTPDEVETLDA